MRVLIIEDEFHTAMQLEEIIQSQEGFEVIEKLESIQEAVPYLHRYQDQLDLLFFDIHLADGNSFEIFKHVDVYVPIVFCTAYDEYGLKAIQSNGIDYILKPFKEDDVIQAVRKYKRLISTLKSKNKEGLQFSAEPNHTYQGQFISQFRERSIVKSVQEITLFCIEHETVFLYDTEGKKWPLFKSLDYIESVVDPSIFHRINRQMLVHISAIESFEPVANRKISLNLTIPIPHDVIVSRLKVSPFKKWLTKHS